MIDRALDPKSPFLTEDDDQPIEIEIGDPNAPIEDETHVEYEKTPSFDANLAEFVDDDQLVSLASDLIDDFEHDRGSRKEWEQTYVDGLDLLGLKIEERTTPWNGACGVYHPMLTEAAIRFQSEMISETFPAIGPCRGKYIGDEDEKARQAVSRVVKDVNYNITEKMTEFRAEHEKMLWALSLAGAAFKKVYFDPSLNRQVSMFVPAEDLYLPYGASDARTAERVTHVMRKTKNDIKKLQYSGFYRDIELGEPSRDITDIQERKDEVDGLRANWDDRYKILEMMVELDLEGFEDVDPDTGEETGIALPYVVTIEKGTSKILSIRRNWDEHDPFKLANQHIVQYTYIPGFGAYGLGLIHLIGGFAKSATSIIRQLIDAGTLSNLPGGLKSRGLRIKGDDSPINPGEWRDVDVPSSNIKDNILPLPYKEPSATLFNLLQNVVEEGRRLAAVADVDAKDMNGEAPVGTTLAILERTLKVTSAVQARVYASMEQEFKLIKKLIGDYTDPSYDYEPEYGAPASVKKQDYDNVNIIPVADPNASTMAQRIIQYQAAIQLAQMAPQIYNLPLLHRQMLEVMGVKDADKIVIVEEDIMPTDPVTENMNIFKLTPVKAFIGQDHDAHLTVHQSVLNDPKIAAVMGQNPNANAIKGALMAHIMEHLGFQYRQGIEQQLGISLPPPEEQLDPQMEVQIAKLSSDAAKQLLQVNQATSAQEQIQKQNQDPLVQMQQKELQLKEQEINDKKLIELEKLKVQKEIAMVNNEAKLLLQNEDAKVEGLFKGMDMATAQQNQPPAPIITPGTPAGSPFPPPNLPTPPQG